MDKIDLSSIQYVEPKEEPEKKKDAPNEKNEKHEIGDIVKKAQKLKREIEKENKEVDKKTDEEKKMDKQRMILILRFYLLEFKDKLTEYKRTKFEKMKLEELHELRKQFDAIISSKSSLKQTQTMIINSIKTIETIATMFTPIQCQGLSNVMINDPDVLDDIKHCSLKHMSMIQVEPEYRLMYKIFTNILLLHNINSSKVRPADINNKLSQVNQKYNDL